MVKRGECCSFSHDFVYGTAEQMPGTGALDREQIRRTWMNSTKSVPSAGKPAGRDDAVNITQEDYLHKCQASKDAFYSA
jgi:hypothetical protein